MFYLTVTFAIVLNPIRYQLREQTVKITQTHLNIFLYGDKIHELRMAIHVTQNNARCDKMKLFTQFITLLFESTVIREVVT